MTSATAANSRAGCRRLIEDTIATALDENPSLGDDVPALFQLVSRAYPFPQRKPKLVAIWTSELRAARARFVERAARAAR